MSTIEVGELLYTVTLNITGVKEYGVSFAALMAGEVTTPVEGARFDVPFEGTATGPKVNGVADGIDYVRVRADGRFELHIHETITAPGWTGPWMTQSCGRSTSWRGWARPRRTCAPCASSS